MSKYTAFKRKSLKCVPSKSSSGLWVVKEGQSNSSDPSLQSIMPLHLEVMGRQDLSSLHMNSSMASQLPLGPGRVKVSLNTV